MQDDPIVKYEITKAPLYDDVFLCCFEIQKWLLYFMYCEGHVTTLLVLIINGNDNIKAQFANFTLYGVKRQKCTYQLNSLLATKSCGVLTPPLIYNCSKATPIT